MFKKHGILVEDIFGISMYPQARSLYDILRRYTKFTGSLYDIQRYVGNNYTNTRNINKLITLGIS